MSQGTKQFACRLSLVTLSFALIVFSGCGKDKPEPKPTTDSDPAESTAALDSNTTSVAATKTTNQTSPATSADQTPGPESSPQEVCERFMQLLQSGNRIGAENLFTRTALTTTTKAGLKLEPMGLPTSTFRIGEVRYATNRKRLAQVDCFIEDKDENGNPSEMEVTWQLHKLSQGFRISGVMLQLGEGKAKDLLSLENAYDVAKLQSLAGADILDEPQSRHANAGQTTIKK